MITTLESCLYYTTTVRCLSSDFFLASISGCNGISLADDMCLKCILAIPNLISAIGTDKSKITRKPSKMGKHGHENQKSTKRSQRIKAEARNVKPQSNHIEYRGLGISLTQFLRTYQCSVSHADADVDSSKRCGTSNTFDIGYRVLKDLILYRSLINNGASLSNKFGEFYFSFKFGILGLLHHVVTTIADRMRELLEYMDVHDNDASESSQPSWGKIMYMGEVVYSTSLSMVCVKYSAYVRRIVAEQVKTQKIQAGVQVSRLEDKDVIFNIGSALKDFIMLYFVLVRNICPLQCSIKMTKSRGQNGTP
ncbi:hypothetical protein Tco_1272590 [Tanacetum coccineum]